MNAGRTVFSQLIEFLPHQEFQKCVARYAGDRYLKNFSCWDQYLAMSFAQLTYRESGATSRPACAPSAASFTTWDFAARWCAPRWPMPTVSLWLICKGKEYRLTGKSDLLSRIGSDLNYPTNLPVVSHGR